MDIHHEQFMAQAIALAEESVRSGGGPFGSVIVKDGEIVGRGMNRVTVWNDPTAHGEIVAIRDACRNLNTYQLKGCTLYTNAEPCPMCFGAVYWARLHEVYYAESKDATSELGFDDSFIGVEFNKDPSEQMIPMRKITIARSEDPFRQWDELKEKQAY
jgi:tRNA(Arg) A34 adenosine deaminase TadA